MSIFSNLGDASYNPVSKEYTLTISRTSSNSAGSIFTAQSPTTNYLTSVWYTLPSSSNIAYNYWQQVGDNNSNIRVNLNNSNIQLFINAVNVLTSNINVALAFNQSNNVLVNVLNNTLYLKVNNANVFKLTSSNIPTTYNNTPLIKYSASNIPQSSNFLHKIKAPLTQNNLGFDNHALFNSNVFVSGSLTASNISASNLTALSNTAVNASNVATWSSNAAVSASNKAFETSNAIFPVSFFASNVAVSASNKAFETSNAIFPVSFFASNVATWSSNTISPTSNLSYNLSNYTYGVLTPLANSNNSNNSAGVWASNNFGASVMSNFSNIVCCNLDVNNPPAYRLLGIDAPNAVAINGALLCKAGVDDGTSFNPSIIFTYSPGSAFRHAINSRHSVLGGACNALDFYIWDNSNDTGSNPTRRPLTIYPFGIGINNPSPTATLHLNGGFRMSSATSNIMRIDGTPSAIASNVFSIGANGQIAVDTSNTTGGRFILTDAGNLGIGNSSPAFKLDVNGNVRLNTAYIGNMGIDGNFAGFAHSNHATVSGYGFLHSSSGTTYINSAPTQAIYFRQSNLDLMSLNSNALTVGVPVAYNSNMTIASSRTLEFGQGVAGKEMNAGKIGYQTFSSSLDIVGAGTTSANRSVRIYDNAIIGGSLTLGGSTFKGLFVGSASISISNNNFVSATITHNWGLSGGQTILCQHNGTGEPLCIQVTSYGANSFVVNIHVATSVNITGTIPIMYIVVNT